MKHYLEEIKDVCQEVDSSLHGLSTEKANEKQEKVGKNKLKEGKKISLIQRFLAQIADPMIIILLIAAVVSCVTTVYEVVSANEAIEFVDFADVFIILFVVILNAVLGVIQEAKAEKAIDALKEMTAATSKVLRDGELVHVKSEDLVPGDVVVLEAGDAVPADGRIIECATLQIEEAALTGESVPSSKTVDTLVSPNGEVPLGDRKNMAYMGSSVVYGRGKMIVTAIGMDTEMGKIANALALAEDEKTPLQRKLAELSKILTYLVLGICVIIFAIGLIKDGVNQTIGFDTVLSSFMIAVSLAVAAIPEGLAAVVTIVLSIGVTKMSKRAAVIRKLTAVETLGCTQIICSDKTGTLTQNKMTVVDQYTESIELLATAMSLCSDADIDKEGKVYGEPTEAALVEYALKNKLPKGELSSKTPRVGEVPFDSMRKKMTTIHKTEKGYIQYSKGAPDELLKNCTHYYTSNGVVELTDAKREEILKQNKYFADKALRVLAAAYKELDEMPEKQDAETCENNLIFIGLTGMIDPVRPEVKDAVNKCKSAGIRTVMITGDHKDTAIAIALDLGIIGSGSEAITGSELDKISDEELDTLIEKYSVYARVQPEHKVRIVKAWKNKNKIVAMTGDGVNDAPSIKSADIGIGMGITGTDVTKNVADMVLADDNFATIVSAVEEGRKIYDNIRKSIQFLLSSNLSEVFSIFIATMIGFTILEPTHLLWINLITDSLPALALGLEEGEPDIMERKPRSATDGIFANGVGIDIIVHGVLVGIITLLSYFLGHYIETGNWNVGEVSHDGMTMAFLTLSMCEIFHGFNMRSQRKSILQLKTMNWWLLGAGALALVLTTAVIYIPGINDLFNFTSINVGEYFIALGVAFSIIPLVELYKLVWRIVEKRKK